MYQVNIKKNTSHWPFPSFESILFSSCQQYYFMIQNTVGIIVFCQVLVKCAHGPKELEAVFMLGWLISSEGSELVSAF